MILYTFTTGRYLETLVELARCRFRTYRPCLQTDFSERGYRPGTDHYSNHRNIGTWLYFYWLSGTAIYSLVLPAISNSGLPIWRICLVGFFLAQASKRKFYWPFRFCLEHGLCAFIFVFYPEPENCLHWKYQYKLSLGAGVLSTFAKPATLQNNPGADNLTFQHLYASQLRKHQHPRGH